MATATQQIRHNFVPRGASNQLFSTRDPEIVLSGPAGTGKSTGMVQKIHAVLHKWPQAKGLLCRKVGATIPGTGLETYRECLTEYDHVAPFGGSGREPAHYLYPNGSKFYWGGLSKTSAEQSAPKIMSAQYDIIGVQQAEELSETDWEHLTTRLRNGKVPYQQIIGDVNPQAPTHWLKLRCDRGQSIMLKSWHEDNPLLFDENREMTLIGRNYMAVLNNLTGVRYKRLRLGDWAAAEGIVFELDRRIHLIDTYDISLAKQIYATVDFGFKNAGVIQIWAIDGDGRMIMVREQYQSLRTFEWWVEEMKMLYDMYRFRMAICDPSEPGMIESFKNAGVPAQGGRNEIRLGIQEVQARLRVQADGRPRLFLCRDALMQRDNNLAEEGLPLCTEQEFDSYVYEEDVGGKPNKEIPIDEHNHGIDALRYMALYLMQPVMPYAWMSTPAEVKISDEGQEKPVPPIPFPNPFRD